MNYVFKKQLNVVFILDNMYKPGNKNYMHLVFTYSFVYYNHIYEKYLQIPITHIPTIGIE